MIDLHAPPKKPVIAFPKPAIIMPHRRVITPAEARGIETIPPIGFDPILGFVGTAAGHGARMAASNGGIEFVGYILVYDTDPLTSGQTLTIPLSGFTGGVDTGLVEGDMVIVFGVGHDNVRFDSTLSMSTAGYTQIVALDSGTGPNGYADSESLSAYKFMGATPDASITMNFGSMSNGSNTGVPYLYALAFRGVDPTNPLDVAVVSHATGQSSYRPNPDAITPVTDGNVILVLGSGAMTNSTGHYYTQPGSEYDTFVSPVSPALSGSAVSDYYYGGVTGFGIRYNNGTSAFDGAQWNGTKTDASIYGNTVQTIALRPA